MQSVLGTVGFSVAAVAYAVVATLVLLSGDRSRQARYLSAALVVSVAWAVWHIVANAQPMHAMYPSSVIADSIRSGVWIAYLVAVLKDVDSDTPGRRLCLYVLAGGIAASLIAALMGSTVGRAETARVAEFAYAVMVIVPLLGILGLEQIFRNSDIQQRSIFEPLVLGVGFLFAADALVYSYALAFADTDTSLSVSRSIVSILAAPAIAVTARRWLRWNTVLFLSRDFTFYTASLVGVALYVAAMVAAAFLFASSGSRWGILAQSALLLAGLFVLYRLLFSGAVRRSIRVFITKHFYRERYDYRKEWLRLIETLVGREEEASIAVRAVRALAEIIGSDEGELWLEGGPGLAYEPHGSWGGPMPSESLNRSDALPAYLAQSHWVVDTQEYLNKPSVYSNVFAFDEPFLKQPSIYVPILHKDRLIGVVRLERPPGIGDLSFEDHDLLKTAGQQIAVFLVQERAQELLFETRQFEAFSKLTAFLMHDLKNVIAQQNLVVANARRFRHRPEFIDDAISTISSSVERMRRILERLQGATRFEKSSRIQLHGLLQEVCNECVDRRPSPVLSATGDDELFVEMDRDRLNMVVTHLVRNAQDATQPDGHVQVLVSREDAYARIEVSDDGCGMDAEFIRDRLFKPFDSTKGAQGMGIGAYQIRETVNAVGGTCEVKSEPGVGTTMVIKLPLVTVRPASGWLAATEQATSSGKVPDVAGS